MDDDPSPSTRAPDTPTRTLTVEILDTNHSLDAPSLAWLTDAANRVCASLPNTGEIRVSVVDDRRMREAHNRYSALDSTTDVLTFDLAHDQPADTSKVLDADLFVCADEAQRQAQTRNHDTKHELLLYIVHGVLHCLGYDDHTEEDYQAMHAREDQLLNAAGFDALFEGNTRENTP